ncbi:hypothetical protein ACGF3C_18165 [Micromonospora sp. NPDC047762]
MRWTVRLAVTLPVLLTALAAGAVNAVAAPADGDLGLALRPGQDQQGW